MNSTSIMKSNSTFKPFLKISFQLQTVYNGIMATIVIMLHFEIKFDRLKLFKKPQKNMKDNNELFILIKSFLTITENYAFKEDK